MKELSRKTWVFLWSLFLFLLGISVFSIAYREALPKILEEINNSLLSALLTAIITMFLLTHQTETEEEREKNSKVFEEKLAIYKDFLAFFNKIVRDKVIDTLSSSSSAEDELEELIFQLSYIKMHSTNETTNLVFQKVKEVILILKELEERGEDYVEVYYSELSKILFEIVSIFQKELYGQKALNLGVSGKLEFQEVLKTATKEIVAEVDGRKREESFLKKLLGKDKLKIGDLLFFKPALDEGFPKTDNRVGFKLVSGKRKCLESLANKEVHSFSSARKAVVTDLGLADVNIWWGFTLKDQWVNEAGKPLSELLKN